MQTFLVRVWTPAAGEENDERRPLSGVVEHVASRRGATFHGELDLLDFIRGCLQAPPEVLPAVVDEVRPGPPDATAGRPTAGEWAGRRDTPV